MNWRLVSSHRIFCSSALVVVGATLFGALPAQAVPAFARKYQTSCQTCHVIFPKLNAFGEAFRLRGYRMPNETEDLVKEKPVSLGAPAYKRLWPKAVWPGELPGTVPLAVNVKFADANSSTLNEDLSVTKVSNDLQFPQEVNLFGAGTLGDRLSFFTELTVGENPDASAAIEIEHARFQFDSPFGPEDLLHIRIGKFAPNIADGFQEMWIATDAGIDTMFAYNPVGLEGGTGLAEDVSPAPISLPSSVRGIEAYGIIAHRAMWVAGLANGISPGPNGRFDGNDAKDLYARFDYKFGGMGLDGDNGGKAVPAENWRDDSLRVGGFVYRGDGNAIDYPFVTGDGTDLNVQDVHFLRTGIYASLFVGDLNVFGVYLRGTDTLRWFDAETSSLLQEVKPDYHAFFVQADYLLYPWLQVSGRYETLTPGDPGVQSLRLGTFNVSALLRANVKVMAEYQRDLREGQNNSLNAIVRFAF